eukprot:137783-Chlamydomonas_euryale.AAC.1
MPRPATRVVQHVHAWPRHTRGAAHARLGGWEGGVRWCVFIGKRGVLGESLPGHAWMDRVSWQGMLAAWLWEYVQRPCCCLPANRSCLPTPSC